VVPGESIARGVLQGLSAGWGDEAAGAVAAALPFTDPEAAQGETFSERRKNARDFYRGRNAAAEAAGPKQYLGGQVAGGVVGAGKLRAGMAGVAQSAGMGMAAGSGYSEENEARRLLRDTALGGALGLVGHGAGSAVGKVFDWVRGKGASIASAARGKAAQEGAEAALAPVRSIEASARERAANAYRQMERVNLALADPALPAADRVALEAFKQGPEYAELVAINAKGILASAPDAAAELSAAKQVAAEARSALPAEIARETEARLVPQKGADIASFLKSYAEPLAWGAAGYGIGDALDLSPGAKAGLGTVAGAIGGRTRAGKALMTRLNRPAHQLQFAEALQGLADKGSPLAKRLLQLSGPAAIASRLERTDE